MMYNSKFERVEPGTDFLMENPDYKHEMWPYCGPAFVTWTRLAEPTPEGFNAVDHAGTLRRLADGDAVVISTGGLR